MQRRDLLKLLATAAVSSAIPQELLALGRQLQGQISSGTTLRTLNPHQSGTVTAIAEMIVPETDTPGAKATRVIEFIDLILTDWYAPEETQRFLDGLANADARCRQLFGKDFVDCGDQQQREVLTTLDADVSAELELRRSGMHNHDQEEKPQHFFYMMKQLTLIGYCTSEAGAQAVGFEVIPTEHGASLPATESTSAARG